MNTVNTIPSLDLSDFKSNNTEKKINFVQKLGEAYEEVGFLSLKNYGLTNEVEQELYQEVYNFLIYLLKLNQNMKNLN